MIHGAKKIIVIGGNAAGPAAAAKAKRVNPDSEVILFESGQFISTGTCELPYLLSGEIDDYKKIVFFDPESFYKTKGVKVYLNYRVEEINRKEKFIVVRNLSDSTLSNHEYDSLILTTGSKAKIPSGFSVLPENAFCLKSVSDYLSIKNYLDNNHVNDVVIFGAGYIGLETADAFKKKNINLTIIEKDNLPLPGYEYEIRNLVKDILQKNNINFIAESGLPRFNYKLNRIESITGNGNHLKSDLILFAIGVEPNNSLAVSSGLNTGKWGGIVVDNYLRTSDNSIYAAGDVIEVQDKISGRNIYLPLATLAHSQGHTAGANAGGSRIKNEPVVRNIAVKIFDKVFSQVGLTTEEAMELNINCDSVTALVPNLVKVMPGSEKVFGKLLFNKYNGKIYGASFLGTNEVTGYADLISMLIYKNGVVEDLGKMNFNYTPPSSPFVNILSVLSRKAGENVK